MLTRDSFRGFIHPPLFPGPWGWPAWVMIWWFLQPNPLPTERRKFLLGEQKPVREELTKRSPFIPRTEGSPMGIWPQGPKIGYVEFHLLVQRGIRDVPMGSQPPTCAQWAPKELDTAYHVFQHLLLSGYSWVIVIRLMRHCFLSTCVHHLGKVIQGAPFGFLTSIWPKQGLQLVLIWDLRWAIFSSWSEPTEDC